MTRFQFWRLLTQWPMLLLPIIGGCCAAFFLSRILLALALRPWRRSAGQHWTERSRVLYPARVSAGLNVLLITANVVLAELFIEPALSGCWRTLIFLTWPCALSANFWFQREIIPRLTFRLWLNQIIIIWGVWYGVVLLYLACAILMPPTFGWPAFALAGGALAFHIGQLSPGRVRCMRWAKLLVPADERLQRIVSETSARMNVPVNGVWQMPAIFAQAYALPLTRELLFSTRLLEICNDREVTAICAHELSHLTESKAVLWRRIAGSFAFYPLLFLKPAILSGSHWGFLLPVPTLLLLLLIRKLSIRMERRADKIAAEDQAEAGVYGNALEKLYRENLIPAVTASRNPTHPHLYDRLVAAGITPDYPRPKPAKKYQWSSLVLYACLIIGFLVYLNLFCNPKPPLRS